ncbi:hypothetical protein ACFL0X_00585 [Nanoarchaeota archaeon]
MSLNKITAILMIEVIGKPPEHLREMLNKIIENIGNEKGVVVKEKKVNESTLMKDSKEFYINFAEVEVEIEEMVSLLGLMLKYMPAHIEIIKPEKISLTNNDWNILLNEVALRLHQYDEVARVLQTEKKILVGKLKEVLNKNANTKAS